MELASGQGQAAKQFFQESVAIWREIGEQGSLAQTLNALGHTFLSLKDHQTAWPCFLEALALARDAEIIPVALETLPGVAPLRTQAGDIATALEITLALRAHPAAPYQTYASAEQLRSELEARLPTEQVDSIHL